MNNQNQNPLPLLPDPLENQPAALPAPTAPTAPVMPAAPAQTLPTGRQAHRNYLRAGLIVGGVVTVLLLVLFGSRLADLLNLRGTKAGQSVILNSDNFIEAGSDWEGVPSNDYFTVQNGKLMLSNPGTGQ